MRRSELFKTPGRLRKGLARIFALSIFVFLSGCTAMKFVPEGEALYVKSEAKVIPRERIKAKNKVEDLMDENVNPKPNTSIFGMRPTLWVYYAIGEPKNKLRRFIKNKIGQAPVYMSDVDPDKTVNLIEGHLKNNGFFQAEAESSQEIKDKKGKVIYTAYVHRPYKIRNINTPIVDTLFQNIDSLKNESYVKKGQRYSLERLQAEQERLEEALENLGFYYFDDRHLIFEADSTVGDKEVDLTLKLEKGVPANAKRKYTINNVNIFTDYAMSLDTPAIIPDTIKLNQYNYITRKHEFRPKVITDIVNFQEGKIYRTIDREYTISHIMSMGAFKFVNIKFDEVDSAKLDANIYLTPYLKKSIRAEFQATSKSNNFVGPGLEITFTNRNAFGGSERLELVLTSGYEVQIGRKIENPLNALELGGEARLTIPRLLVPFKINYPSRRYLPSTHASLSSRIQRRIGYFSMNSVNFNFGYTWRENTLKSHEFYPIDLTYVNVSNTSPEFDTLLNRNFFLRRSFENQFIPGIRYSYTLNTQLDQQRAEKYREQEFERSHFYFNLSLDAAGNIIHALQGKGFEQDPTQESGRILGSAYSQFSRGEIDFRYYYNLDENNQLVGRINAGVGYAYGNSVTMPYVRQFSVGGSTSIRAFPARSLGPGTFYIFEDVEDEETSGQSFFIDQRGDIKLEGNAEFRYSISNTIKTALFVDAGNIWLMRTDTTRKGGEFEKHDFVNEIAVGTGLGVRFDFTFFVLRFDLAFPIRKPWLPAGERWVFNDIDVGSGAWRRENLILNIAIGYPF